MIFKIKINILQGSNPNPNPNPIMNDDEKQFEEVMCIVSKESKFTTYLLGNFELEVYYKFIDV